MAYPSKTAKWASTTNTTAETVDLGFSAAAGDLLVVHIGWRSTSATAAVTGFTALDSRRSNDAWSSQCFVKTAAGGETSVDVTFSASSFSWGLIACAVPDADVSVSAAAAIDGVAFNAGATAATLASPSLTTTTDACALLHFSTWDSVYQTPDHESINCVALNMTATASQTYTAAAIGYQATAGAIPTWNYSANNAVNAGLSWVLAIKNAAGGNAPIVMDDGRKYVQRLAGFDTISGGAPNSVSGLTTISSIPMGASTVSASVVGVPQAAIGSWGVPATIVRSAENLDAGTYPNGAFVGLWATMASKNIAGKNIVVPFGYGGTTDNTRVGPLGAIIVFADSLNNWAAYQLEPQVKWANNSARVVTFNTTNTTKLDGSVTPVDFTDVVACFYGYHRKPTTATQVDLYVGSPVYEDAASVFIRGGAGNPITVKQIARYMNGDGLFPEHASFQGSGQLVGKLGVQIGDGTTATYARLTTQSLETPNAENALWRSGANTLPLTIKASASDTIDLSSSIIATEYEHPMTIDAASSLSATYDFANASIIGRAFSDAAGVSSTGATWSGGNTVAIAGSPTIASFAVLETTSTNAAMSFSASGVTLDTGTIESNGADYHIELGASNTAITLADVTFSGTPGTDKVHVLATTGTVTITISGSTALVAGDVTSAGATVVIAAPTPTLDATVLAGSRVVLYNNTTAAELDNTAPAGTSWSKQITSGASSGDSLTLHVFKLGYEEFSTTFLYTGEDATLLVTQVADSSEDALVTELGYDGSSVTEFALDITGTVEIDADDVDGLSLKARFALWYKYILTSEDGARYLRGFLTLVSPAEFRMNVSVADVKIANISVTQGLQFTDVDRRLYRSDGTPIWATASAPGSIQNDYSGVPDYSLISVGGANIITGDIADIPAAPSADTVASQVRTELTTELAYLDAPVSGATAPSVEAVASQVRVELTTELGRIDAPISGVPAAVGDLTAGARTIAQHLQAQSAAIFGETAGVGTAHIAFTDGTAVVEADVPLPGVLGERTNVVISGV